MNNNQFIRYFEFILRPKKLALIIFSVLISPIILLGLYILSFSWLFSFEDQLIPVYVVAIIIGAITYFLDKRFRTRFKYYTIVAIALLSFYTALSYPVKNWLNSQSKSQGERIAKLVDQYRIVNGHYPDSLNIDYFRDIPQRSYIGTPFIYVKSFDEKKNEEKYCIEYISFRGYLGHYSTERNEWFYTD